MPYKIVGKDHAHEFDEEVKKHSQILQSYEWGEVKGDFGWQPIRLMLEKGGPVTILKRELPFVRRSFFYIPRGPLIDFKNEEVLEEFQSAITIEALKHKALFLRIDPEIDEKDAEALKALRKRGFVKAKKEIQPRSTYILDICHDLDHIKGRFESKFRYNIHVAEKNGIVVRHERDEQAINAFYSIYKETGKRQTFIIHPLSYYRKIFFQMIRKDNGAVFVAYHNNDPVAAIILLSFGKRVWYMYGASSARARNMMPNNLLHWEAIKWAKEKGFCEYDLWGIPSKPVEGHPLWGVYKFKKGFSARLERFIGTWDLPFDRTLYRIFDNGIIFYQNLMRFMKKGSMSDSLSE